MMGKQPPSQGKLFYHSFNLDERVRKDHILRKIARHIDFNFIYNEVKNKYGVKGNVSIPPPVILKLILLLILYNVRSERELMLTVPERLDWLWFLGYDIDDEVPHHSVLSKARRRWGVKAFKRFFERIVWQCVEAGLVDGRKLFMDSSLVDADASNNSVIEKRPMAVYVNKGYQELESRLEEREKEKKAVEGNDQDNDQSQGEVSKSGKMNKRYISTTDPDASVVRRKGRKSKLQYQIHRGVDPENEVITTTEVTPGEVNEAHRMESLIKTHHKNTGIKVAIAIGDSKYGTIENLIFCHDEEIKAHFVPLEKTHKGSGHKGEIFPKEAFVYDLESDTFICPAGEVLRRRSYYKKRQHYEYRTAKGVCAGCDLKKQCTRAKDGRSLKRHIRQDDLDEMIRQAETWEAKADIKTRQHLMERSFARSKRYGYKRARWRRLWRVEIQEYLTASIQNIMVLLKHIEKTPSMAVSKAIYSWDKVYSYCSSFYCYLRLVFIYKFVRFIQIKPIFAVIRNI